MSWQYLVRTACSTLVAGSNDELTSQLVGIEDGRVWSWGDGSHYQLGHGSKDNCYRPSVVEALHNQRFVRVCAGPHHSHAIESGGGLYAWGSGENGELGLGRDTSIASEPMKVDMCIRPDGWIGQPNQEGSLHRMQPISGIDAGHTYMIAVVADGTVFTVSDLRVTVC